MAFERAARDVRYAVRTLRKSPAFTLVALAMLALGIGANTAIFSVVSAVLLRPLPFPEPQRLVLLWENFSATGGPARVEASPADYVAWKERSHSFTDVAAFVTESYNLTGSGEPEKLSGIRTTGNLFNVLGMQAIVGRTLAPGDEAADAPPVVVLDERVWRSRFGADPGIVGHQLRLNGLPYTVVGIIPADFRFPDKSASVWVPARFTPTELAPRDSYFFYVAARLKAGVSLSQAKADMAAVARQLGRDFPGSNSRTSVTVAALHEHLTREVRPEMAVLLGAVIVVLLIAGANLANLLLTRGTSRIKEMAVRQALGATERLITRQLLTENAVLAAAGAILGVALAVPALRYVARLVPSGLPDATPVTLDVRVLLFTAAITALIVLGFGTGPAFAAARVNLESAIRSGTNRGTTARRRRLHGALVVAELTLTVVLLIAGGLLLRSYSNVLSVDPGFNPHNLLIAQTVLPPSKYADTAVRSAFYTRVLQRVTTLPGVTAAGFTNFPPMVFKGGRALISAEGEPRPTPQQVSRYIAIDRVAGPGYFRALGVPVIRGRGFEDRDAESSVPAAVVNEKMARLHWPGQDPIGRRIKFGPATAPGRWLTVVGVIGDVHEMGLDSAVEPEMYVAANQGQDVPPFLWPQYLVVRTSGDPLAIAGAIRRAVWGVDADQAVSDIASMDEIFDRELLNRSTQLTLVAVFAALAFVMAAIGLYGVLSYAVAQQLPEIGVKMALGAGRWTVVLEVIRGAMLLATTGIVIGLATAIALSRVLRVWLFEVSPLDTATFVVTALLIGVTALVASSVPAMRGARVDPAVVLRAD
jgi:putative ABC transport system permease protein